MSGLQKLSSEVRLWVRSIAGITEYVDRNVILMLGIAFPVTAVVLRDMNIFHEPFVASFVIISLYAIGGVCIVYAMYDLGKELSAKETAKSEE